MLLPTLALNIGIGPKLCAAALSNVNEIAVVKISSRHVLISIKELVKILKMTSSTCSPSKIQNLWIYEYNIVHLKSLSAGQKMFPTSLKSQVSVFVRQTNCGPCLAFKLVVMSWNPACTNTSQTQIWGERQRNFPPVSSLQTLHIHHPAEWSSSTQAK